MPDDADRPAVPPAQPQPQVQVVNQPDGPAMLGLRGYLATAANFSAVVIIAAVFLWLLNIQIQQGRQDRLDDRQTFRETLKEVNADADRRANMLDRTVDGNTQVIRDLTTELRGMRSKGVTRPEPKEGKP